MIGQNRQAAFAAAKANHDFVEQETELKHNTELTRQIHELTTQIHAAVNAEIARYRRRTAPSTRSSTASRSSSVTPIARCSTRPSSTSSRNAASVFDRHVGAQRASVNATLKPFAGGPADR